MAKIPQIISFLRSCYEADNRETGISNLLNKKNRHVYFFDGDETVLQGLTSLAPIDQAVATEAQKESQLYRRDKTLVYASLFLVGYPGQLAEAYSLERYRTLERAGLSVVPLAYRDWLQDPTKCLSQMLDDGDLSPANRKLDLPPR